MFLPIGNRTIGGLSACMLITLGFIATHAYAADCNFDKPVGKCVGSISIDSTGGSKPSYSAEITVSSTAPSCSRVEYFIDNTPQSTILRSGSEDQESVSGTSPIKRSTFKGIKCTRYEDRADAGSQEQRDKNTSLEGVWSGITIGPGGSRNQTITIDVNGSSATATTATGNVYEGSVNGSTFSGTSSITGTQLTLRMTSKGKLSYRGVGPGVVEGTLTRN